MNYTDEQLRSMPLWDLVEHYGYLYEDRLANINTGSYFLIVERILRERIKAHDK